MNYFDLILVLPIIYGVYKGFRRGLVLEFTSLLALVLGIYGASIFSKMTFEYLSNWLDIESSYLSVASYAITFISIVIIVSLGGKLLTLLLKMVALGFLNRIMGSLFGGLKSLLLISIFLIFFDKFVKPFGFVKPDLLNDSVFYEPMVKYTLDIYPDILKELQKI
jgi:membrane protein required for colicin V production|tara:strand:- start:7505 stop:7999 length:495 start_codon:yes stop_codon:yes gene_type:complete